MGFLAEGKKVEQEFAKVLSLPIFSSKKEDIEDHWDVMDSDGYRYDVKGMKKRRRSDSDVNPDWHWIEIRNVNGDDGWLYGQADYIVFEHRKYWIVVNRKELIEELETIHIEERRTRDGRSDLIYRIQTIDLIIICEKLIDKAK
jgi:hypothetical protein